ncbi:MAG: hypothetical protein OXT73_07600 [Bacteroidota bacterium]|nr:hypothetical protein [Bacteroidota bacterium]
MPLIFEFMLLGAGLLALILVARWLIKQMPGNQPYKYGLGLAIAAVFLLFWMNGAVGIIGAENNDANMWYLAVIGLAVFGSIVVRYRSAGMAWIMGSCAAGMIVIALVALVLGWGFSGPVWPNDVIMITIFFVSMFAGSAWLFQQAAGKREQVEE